MRINPNISQLYQSSQLAYAKETAENEERTAQLLSDLISELEKEKAERKSSEKKALFISYLTLAIAALTLIATIIVPIALQR